MLKELGRNTELMLCSTKLVCSLISVRKTDWKIGKACAKKRISLPDALSYSVCIPEAFEAVGFGDSGKTRVICALTPLLLFGTRGLFFRKDSVCCTAHLFSWGWDPCRSALYILSGSRIGGIGQWKIFSYRKRFFGKYITVPNASHSKYLTFSRALAFLHAKNGISIITDDERLLINYWWHSKNFGMLQYILRCGQ